MAGLLDFFRGAPVATQNGQATGLLGGFGQGLRDNSSALMGFGMGMLSGDTPQDGFGNAFQGMQQGQNMALKRKLLADQEMEKAKKLEAAKVYAAKYPQFAPLLEANPELADKFAAAEFGRQLNPPDPLESEYKRAQIENLRAQAQGKNATFGLNPVYGTRVGPDGKEETVILQPGNNGTIVEPKLPEGVKLANGIEKIDAGTQWIIKDKRTGQTIGYEPKNVAAEAAEKAAGKEKGEVQAAAAINLPETLAVADQQIADIKALKTHPGRKTALGYRANFPTVKGTDADALERRVEQVKGGAYLKAIQQMRGLGALSEQEGKAATAALTRLNVALNEKEFDAALDELTTILERGKTEAVRKAQGNFGAPKAAKTGSGVSWGVVD